MKFSKIIVLVFACIMSMITCNMAVLNKNMACCRITKGPKSKHTLIGKGACEGKNRKPVDMKICGKKLSILKNKAKGLRGKGKAKGKGKGKGF